MRRLNYFFLPCEGVTTAGASVKLDGFGIVTIDDVGDREEVYLPAQLVRHVLVQGEIHRLEKKGLAECYGRTWKD